jgi:hypothetical protein
MGETVPKGIRDYKNVDWTGDSKPFTLSPTNFLSSPSGVTFLLKAIILMENQYSLKAGSE